VTAETERATLPDLTIERIETVAMRVPLDRVYKGSHYPASAAAAISAAAAAAVRMRCTVWVMAPEDAG
jgi:hypothetical protein